MSGSDVLTIPHYSASERKFYFERWQDCEDIVENNKKLQNTPRTGYESFRYKASIPNGILEKWLREEWHRGNVNLKLFGPEMDRIVEKKLRDPDWRWLLTDAPGTKYVNVNWLKKDNSGVFIPDTGTQ